MEPIGTKQLHLFDCGSGALALCGGGRGPLPRPHHRYIHRCDHRGDARPRRVELQSRAPLVANGSGFCRCHLDRHRVRPDLGGNRSALRAAMHHAWFFCSDSMAGGPAGAFHGINRCEQGHRCRVHIFAVRNNLGDAVSAGRRSGTRVLQRTGCSEVVRQLSAPCVL